MDSRPVYEEFEIPVRVNGVTYLHKVLHFSAAVLPLVLAGLTSPEEWELAETASGYCVLFGPLFAAVGAAVDTIGKRAGDTLRSPRDS